MADKKKVHLVTYTHWDREFRWEFERTRMRLVDCIDNLLELMEKKKDYKSFLFDGQLTLIEDYLEIRPENREKIIELVKQGRLEIGPWYTLADCAPIQGESVVRNLMYGIEKSKEYGDVLKCGYNVFSFGQIGQLPQIYANFGIDTIIFYKHMDPKKSKYHEFIWEAPDGTRAYASRLGKEARWNFFFAGHIPIVYDKDAWHKDWKYKWGELGKVFHTADKEGYGWFYEILDPEISYHPQNIKMGMERALSTVEGTAVPESVLMFEGTDFTEPHPLTPEIIRDIQKEFGDKIDFVHSTLSDYLSEVKEKLKKKDDLDIVRGPMRDGPVGSIHTDVFTIHPEIMMENSHAENKILRWAEPLSTIAWKHGIDKYPKTYLDKIWKLMFESHAHDSMHGLGPVTLLEGEMGRLKQAHVIARGLERRGLESITKEINTSKVKDTELFITVHNPSSFERSEVVEAYIDIPDDVILDHLVIEDIDGNCVQIQEVSKEKTRAGIYHPRSRNMPFYVTKSHIYFMATDVPAVGYKTFKVKWSEKNEYPYPHEDWDKPRIYSENMLSGVNQAENEYIIVKVNADGTVDITDKESGRLYSGLNYFMDMGDKGNMWMSDSPANDRIISSLGAAAIVGVTCNGPLVVKFKIDLKMSLPIELDKIKGKRSEVERELPVSVELTLKKGCKYLEVDTSINNTVKDHYFKVCFPTNLEAEKTWAEGSFSVTEFPVKPSIDGILRGTELARHPAQMWFDLSDGKDGLAVLTDATKDYEILENNKNKTMAMGLVRSVELKIPCDNRLWMEYPGDESAQSLREYSYRYALMPHESLWDEALLYNSALEFNAPLHVCQFGKQEGKLPLEKSFVKIIGDNLVLSSIKKADKSDSVIIRFYNPTDKTIQGSIDMGFDFKEAYLINMGEERIKPLDKDGDSIKLAVEKGKIITVEVV